MQSSNFGNSSFVQRFLHRLPFLLLHLQRTGLLLMESMGRRNRQDDLKVPVHHLYTCLVILECTSPSEDFPQILPTLHPDVAPPKVLPLVVHQCIDNISPPHSPLQRSNRPSRQLQAITHHVLWLSHLNRLTYPVDAPRSRNPPRLYRLVHGQASMDYPHVLPQEMSVVVNSPHPTSLDLFLPLNHQPETPHHRSTPPAPPDPVSQNAVGHRAVYPLITTPPHYGCPRMNVRILYQDRIWRLSHILMHLRKLYRIIITTLILYLPSKRVC